MGPSAMAFSPQEDSKNAVVIPYSQSWIFFNFLTCMHHYMLIYVVWACAGDKTNKNAHICVHV